MREMSVFSGLINDLFTPEAPRLSPKETKQRVERVGREVGERIDRFAERYLSPDAYERYEDRLRNLTYEIVDLPTGIIGFFDGIGRRVKKIYQGVLGYLDSGRNRIGVNRDLAEDPESDGQLKSAMAHEKVHLATADWLSEYFKRAGEEARPIIEGFTALINGSLGNGMGEYPEWAQAAYETLTRFGSSVQNNLYRILNFDISPETVVDTFYRCLDRLQPRQSAYALARAR